ncbi:WD domain-containing protein [Pleurostoma richardsiae]|uniref:WD domain-containing protein n=1 Tax=Pleurostoma richardsiae TaxID=41990 RepID=A0AA38S597_9PEZI|nr:WD domain-containing protein [Pleurostoma richardsiae]
MQRSGATPIQNATSLFSGFSFGSSTIITGGGAGNSTTSSRSRPGTSSGEPQDQSQQQQYRPNVLTKDRKSSSSRKSSFSSPSKSGKRRANSSSSATNGIGIAIVTDDAVPPALPDFALAAAAKLSRETEALQSPASDYSFSRMLSRTAPTPTNGYSASALAPPPTVGGQTESSIVYQHIHEMASKRISTLDYLRKTHEGRVYWFNTLLFDKPDLARMPYFDSRKLARRATNYLLLGLSLPTVIDLNSSTPLEFLRSLNTLLTEFDSFQQLHSENGSASSSLSRARLPQMFRRAAPSSKGRRSSAANDIGYTLEPVDSNSGSGGNIPASSSGGAPGSGGASVITFAASETDLLPGEEYIHLLTPSLPFDPDFFETFATLCDVLIDCYTRLLSLLPTPRECQGPVAELFTKADAKVRKLIIQGVVKEFEDSSRAGVRTEVANVGKVVLSGLM